MRSRALASRYREPFILLLVFTLFIISTINNSTRAPSRRLKEEIEKRILEYPSVSNDFLQQQLDIDRSDQFEIDDLRHEVQEALPNLPIDFWQANKNEPLYYKNKSCAPFPDVGTLKINNLYWQTLNSMNGTFNLFGAYYDVRRRSSVGPSVRILAMIDRTKPTVETYCQVWFADRDEPVITKTLEYRLIWMWEKRKDVYYPHLITCPIPNFVEHETPIFVSLVEKICDRATNSLRVIYNTPSHAEKKDQFAVCVKYLDLLHEDQSVRLIEWIELMKLLGARKIFFYEWQIHKNMSKVLEYYEQRDVVEVTPITFVGNYSFIPGFQHLCSDKYKCLTQKFQNELISLNDCFYKNIYRYDYITLLDTDEVIVPRKADNWTDLMSTILKNISSKSKTAQIRSHFIAKNILFLPDNDYTSDIHKDIPSYMYMLQHVLREEKHMNRGPKTFFDTEMIETVHNHWPVSCLNKKCTTYSISIEDAQLQHYRNEVYLDSHKRSSDSSHRVNDTTIWKYKKPLIDRTLAVLYDLGFYG